MCIRDSIRAGQLVEVDVRALRQCWVVPELPAELPERGFVLPGKVRRLHREVRDAGVSKLDVAAPVCPAVHIQRLSIDRFQVVREGL